MCYHSETVDEREKKTWGTNKLLGNKPGRSQKMADTEVKCLMEEEAEDKVEERRTEDRDDDMEEKKTRNESAEGLNLSGSTTEKRAPDDMERAQEKTKVRLKNKFTCIYEDTATGPSYLEKVYMQLDIIPNIDEGDFNLHETRHKFRKRGKRSSHNRTRLDCIDIFNQQLFKGRLVKRVMTKGIAGIGKTVVIQWLSLQWAEGKSNQHIDFIFVFPFRELNMLNETMCSLFELLCHFAPELRELEDPRRLVDKQVLFILDGLDECRFPLDFVGDKFVDDLAETSSVDVLLTNLIKGNTFPNALLWITSRPAAANRIPPKYIDQMTEIHGFTRQQTEEYFRNRFNDEDRAKEILSRIKAMMSFSFMSHIPIFCWIIAEVFQKGQGDQKKETITTITELYSQYLLIQTQRSVMRYEEYKTEEMDLKEILEYRPFAIFLKLAQLAFEQLEKGNIMFYEEDLRRCGLDVDNASVFCGLCSEILKQECGLYGRKVFSFVHLSFQEFVAALHVFHCCVTKNIGALKSVLGNVSADLTCHELMKRVVDEALRRKNGQLDMLLCFFLGISLESNQTLLQGFLPQTENGSETAEEMRRYIREPHVGDISPERQMNLFLCMYEMKAQRVQNEIQTYLKSGADLSPIDCAVLSSMLLMSEEVLAEINLVEICEWNEEEKHQGLLPAVKNCRKATLHTFNEDMDILNSIVQAADSSLRDMHLVGVNNSEPPGSVLAVLTAPGCKLKTLRLSGFHLGHNECELLACVIQSTHSLLRELDLRCSFLPHDDYNDDDESPSIALSTALMDPTCKLETFRMSGSYLTSECCKAFTSVLCSNSRLRELDLSNNDLQDSGVKHLSAGLGSPDCRLEKLRLSGCKVTEDGCASLASALGSNPSHLRELDLSFNHPGDLGTKLLSDRLKDPNCRLEKLNLDHDEEHWINPQLLKKYDCQLTMDPNTANNKLLLSEGNRRVRRANEPQPYSDHPERFDNRREVLCRESLTGRRYWEVEPRGFNRIGVVYGSMGRKEALRATSDKLWCCGIYMYPDGVGFNLTFNRDAVFVPTLACSYRLGVYLDWPAGVLSFYNVSADTMTRLHTFNATFTEPLYPWFHIGHGSELTLCRIYPINDSWTSFTPDMLTVSPSTEYKFRFPSAGVFECGSTGLVFGLEGEGEVQYRTVQWDESLLQSAGRTPAGPLFSVQCPQGSVSQLQLAHCADLATLSCEELSVVHITDDGLTILEPLRITQTHVVVNAPHLSLFGLTWLHDRMRSMRCQVLLLARPPRSDHQVLDVFLLPSNVPHQDVKAQHEGSRQITTSSNCVLIRGQDYSLQCQQLYELQPESEPFHPNYGPNYVPTFEVFMDPNARRVGLMIKRPYGAVWSRVVHLTDDVVGPGPSGAQVPSQAEERLLSVRTQFINRASNQLLDTLLDELLTQRVINNGEMEAARATGSRESKARYTIDMVRLMGREASLRFVTIIHSQNPYLFRQLGLR